MSRNVADGWEIGIVLGDLYLNRVLETRVNVGGLCLCMWLRRDDGV